MRGLLKAYIRKPMTREQVRNTEDFFFVFAAVFAVLSLLLVQRILTPVIMPVPS